MAPIQKTGTVSPAANDPAQGVGLVSTDKVSTPVSNPTPVLPDPDRWCWPHSQAITGREIDTFTARLHHFTRRGLAELEAEKLADKLVQRDREADNRRLCLECQHLAGNRSSTWRCSNWRQAVIALRDSDAQLSAALVGQLQRCDGFTDQNHQNQEGTAS